MKKLNSKWYYINCGMCLEGALFGALQHNLLFMIFSLVGAWGTWQVAEKRNAEEKNDTKL